MKKIAKVFEIIGFFIAIVSMCFDVSEKPILSIPILSGWIVFLLAQKWKGLAGCGRNCRRTYAIC